MPVNVTYYFLYLLEATDSYREKFDEMSEIVRAETDNLKKLYRGFDGKPVDNPEEWCKLTGTIDGDIAEVKYYKERIILKVKTKCKAKDLNELFKQAKIKRRKLLENRLVNLENIQSKLREICKEYLFSWKDVPGNDNERLIEFLKKRFGIDWGETAKIEKLNDTIKISTPKNHVFLKLNAEKTKVTIEIDDIRTDEFIVKAEYGKLNIYCKCIQSLYQYPLIEIEKDYKVADFNLEDEAITTFFYEIPHVGDINRFFMIFPVKYKKVLMRVSGPSIMTTKMSDIMRAKLINLLYESALYKMRESERENCKECKKIFGSNYEYLRKYIAEIFFSIESESSGIEMASSVQILSFIMAFGAVAGILAISYAISHIFPFSLEVLKTIIAVILLVLTIFMLWLLIKK